MKFDFFFYSWDLAPNLVDLKHFSIMIVLKYTEDPQRAFYVRCSYCYLPY